MELNQPYNEHVYDFEVLNPDDPMPQRRVVSPLSEAQLKQAGADGFVLLREFVRPDIVESFRGLVDSSRASIFGDSLQDSFSSGRFGGQYIRDLHALDRDAWLLLQVTGIPDLVRSMLGPRIVLRSYSARITHPGSASSTVWHCDQRSRTSPRQPWGADAPSVTVIVYLDDADANSGQTALVPTSHWRWDLPDESRLSGEDAANFITLDGRPGDVLMFHGALWHRGGATHTKLRRVLNLQFAPSWTRRAHFETEPEQPAWMSAAQEAREAERTDNLELLGLGGYM